MLVDIEEFLTDDVVGPLFAVLFVLTLVNGLLAWTPERAERFLARRRLPVTEKTVMAVQAPLTRYRWTLLAILVPAVFGVPYVTGVAYLAPLLVDRIVRPSRFAGVQPTPPYGATRALFSAIAVVVGAAAVGAAHLVAVVRGHPATITAWYAGLGVAGIALAQLAARVRYPPPEPPDVPMSIVATVDRRLRWPAVGAGCYLALLGAGRAARTGAGALTTEWGWTGASVEALRLAETVTYAAGIVVLIVVGFVVPHLDGGRR